MASEWYLNIEPEILTTIEYMLAKKTDAPFPKLVCTVSNENVTPTTFPTLYLWSTFRGDGFDLENDMGSIVSTINIKVWTNTKKRDCEEILAAAEKVMREVFKYRYNQFPTAEISNKIVSGQLICSRVVGASDKLT